jgi:cation transport ATPase
MKRPQRRQRHRAALAPTGGLRVLRRRNHQRFRTIYTCPMHPEIRQDHPGSCPKCGMTLEPVMPTLDNDESPELADFARRFWWTLPFSAVVLVLAMTGHRLALFHGDTQNWIELVLTLPVALWAGWPFYVRGVKSMIHRSPNMWTLIGMGTAWRSSTASSPPWRRRSSRPSSSWTARWRSTSRPRP